MTAPEHSMLAINLVIASGLNRQYGWRPAAAAGLAAILPDWDGIPILWSAAQFDHIHRCWGHSLLSCLLLAIPLAVLDCRFDLMSKLAVFFFRTVHVTIPEAVFQKRADPTVKDYFVWISVLSLAVLTHPFADMIVSGGQGLSNWDVRILWPFSDQGFVCPMIAWGDVGVLILFFCGMFAMIRLKKHLQTVAVLTLAAVICYAVIRFLMKSYLPSF